MTVVERLRLRDFRTHARADVRLAAGLTVVHGPNGVGKTNLLEGLYFGLTGRSCRTGNEREVVRFGSALTRVEVDTTDRDGLPHTLAVGFQPGEPKRFQLDASPAAAPPEPPERPLVSVFLPDRLGLVKGAPSLRRAHLDQVLTALWPARAGVRRAYAQALGQRNALLARVRSGAPASALRAWDLELARHGIALRDTRSAVVAELRGPFAAAATELGLHGQAELHYRPRSAAATPEELAAELADRHDRDVERGFTGHGPHRDELVLRRDGRELRAYGSQGEQRLALLALLLAERDVLAARRTDPPLLLLDDVMSELDAARREALVARITTAGQAVVTATESGHVPLPAAGTPMTQVAITPAGVLQEAA